MKVFVDTNVLLSAALFPGGTVSRCHDAITAGSHHLVVSDQVVAEFRDVVNRKFASRVEVAERFIDFLPSYAHIVVTPSSPADDESAVCTLLRCFRRQNSSIASQWEAEHG